VEQLSLLRESNSALREECAGNLREAARWRSHSSQLEAAVGALKASLHDKQAAAEGAAKERDLAQQEANRWKARAEQVKRGRLTWVGRDAGAARVDWDVCTEDGNRPTKCITYGKHGWEVLELRDSIQE
jgi:hypothetical protein